LELGVIRALSAAVVFGLMILVLWFFVEEENRGEASPRAPPARTATATLCKRWPWWA
jgi:hypothetical protein